MSEDHRYKLIFEELMDKSEDGLLSSIPTALSRISMTNTATFSAAEKKISSDIPLSRLFPPHPCTML